MVSLTVVQSEGDLSGSYSNDGFLNDGQIQVAIQETGSISGTVSPGQNPSVNVTLRSGKCPSQAAAFSGAYDSANRVITMRGSVDILDLDCAVFLSYPITLLLRR